MLTLFAIPKNFRGHIATIQRNAIASWTRLIPRPEIFLFGGEEGTAEIAHELGLRHFPEVARNEFGTPGLGKIPYASRLFKNIATGRQTTSSRIGVSVRIISLEEEERKLLGK